MSESKIKLVRRPTPVRNAALAISLTCNTFLFGLGYAVVSGHIARTEPQGQQVALYSQEDYVTALAGRK